MVVKEMGEKAMQQNIGSLEKFKKSQKNKTKQNNTQTDRAQWGRFIENLGYSLQSLRCC